MTSWDNRTVLITGGSRGIGAALVRQFIDLGCYVIATSTTDSGVNAIMEASGNRRCEAFVLDLSSRDSIADFLKVLKEKNIKIDTLINNAGITDDRLSIQISSAQWDRVIETNLNGTIFLTQGLLRNMIRERFGRIIFISSVVGFTGNPGQTSYCASKAALEGFKKALALEVASRSITVNSIAPGFIATDMTNKLTPEQQVAYQEKIPLGALGVPNDIAHSAIFLASEGARYITGQVLHVNGGLFMP